MDFRNQFGRPGKVVCPLSNALNSEQFDSVDSFLLRFQKQKLFTIYSYLYIHIVCCGETNLTSNRLTINV